VRNRTAIVKHAAVRVAIDPFHTIAGVMEPTSLINKRVLNVKISWRSHLWILIYLKKSMKQKVQVCCEHDGSKKTRIMSISTQTQWP
jgi:hypothetical protein